MGKERSPRRDYGLRTLPWPVHGAYGVYMPYVCYHCVCVCMCTLLILLRLWFSSSGRLIFNLCQFCSAGTTVTHNLFSPVPCHKHMYANTRTHHISSTQHCTIWWVFTECRHWMRRVVSSTLGRHNDWVFVQLLLRNCWWAKSTGDGPSTDSCHFLSECREKLHDRKWCWTWRKTPTMSVQSGKNDTSTKFTQISVLSQKNSKNMINNRSFVLPVLRWYVLSPCCNKFSYN